MILVLMMHISESMLNYDIVLFFNDLFGCMLYDAYLWFIIDL